MLILSLFYFITTVIEVKLQKGFGTNCVEQAWAQNKTRELILQKYSNFFAPLARTEGSSAWFDDDRKPQKSNPIKMWSRHIFHTGCLTLIKESVESKKI